MQNNTSKKALIISILLHAVLLYLCIYKLDMLSSKPYDEDVYAPVEVITDDKTNLKTQTVQKDKVIENEDAKLVKQSAPEKPKEEPKKEEPKKEEPKPEEKPKEDLKKEEQKEADKPKSDVQIKEEPKKPEPKKTEPKKEEKKKEKKKPYVPNVDDMLKNLEKESQGKNPQSKNRKVDASDAKTNVKGNTNFDAESKLSISETNLLKSVINKNWNRIGSEKGNGFKAIIHIKLNMDGTFEVPPIIKNIVCPPTLSCDTLIESVKRAVQMSEPFDGLSAERYDTWKEFELEFSPTE